MAGIANQPFAVLTIVNDDSGVSFLSPAYTRSEAAVDGKAIIDLIRSGSTVGAVSVLFSTTTNFGTAVPGVDYTPTSQTVGFGDGETSKTVFVPISDNQQRDGDRTVGLVLSSPVGALLQAPLTALLTIQDDEQFTGLPPNDRFANAQAITGQKGSVSGSNVGATATPNEPDHGGLTASRSIWYEWTAPADGLVVVDTLGSEFDTTLSVYTGDNLAALQRVASNDDFDQGPNPTVSLRTSGVRFYAYEGQTYKIAVDGRAEGNVVLNWAYNMAGLFQFTASTFTCAETESTILNVTTASSTSGALITVTRLFGARGRVRVFYATVAGSAREGEDYSGGAGTLVFEDFELSKSFIIPVVNNAAKDQSRTFQVTLTGVALDSADQGVGIGDPQLNPDLSQATVTILDINEWPGGSPPPPPYAIFNVERSYLRTTEGVGVVRVGVRRTGVGALSCSVRYTIDSIPPTADNDIYHTFPLQPASDYATPGEDFTHVTGQLSWGDNDYTPKYIDIPIANDDLVEFNEDMLIQLHTPLPQPNTTVGMVGEANLTILFDDLPAGSLDPAYNPDNNPLTSPPQMGNPGANGAVYGIALQPDGKAVLVGSFSVVNVVARNHIARMNTDGSLDTTYDPGTGANGLVTCVDVGPDGKAVIGGAFTSINGQQRYRIARLNADGALDTSFNTGGGADGIVWSVDVLNSGKVLIAGAFRTVNGFPRNFVARLNSDGSVDETFDPGSGPDAYVNAVIGTPGGEVWIGGAFTSVAGNLLPHVARLDSSGVVQPAYVPGSGFDGEVFALELQLNGQLLVGGNFRQFNEVPRRCLARVNPDGSLDAGFDPGNGADDVIYEIAYVAAAVPVDEGLGTDRIYVAGQFQQFNQTRRVALARLYSNGTVDTSFLDTAYNQFAGLCNPNATDPRNYLFSVVAQPDGDVLIGGGFARVGGGRLNPSVQTFVNDTIAQTRAAYRPRANFARLLGGETVGPGQILFPQVQYRSGRGFHECLCDVASQERHLGTGLRRLHDRRTPVRARRGGHRDGLPMPGVQSRLHHQLGPHLDAQRWTVGHQQQHAQREWRLPEQHSR